jgi:FkbM family methyltransferase
MYEEVHFSSVQSLMKPGDLFFDIGACDGQTSVLIADKVGPSNVVIIEPAEKNWSYIKNFWYGHFTEVPRATYAGFLEANDKPGQDCHSVVFQKNWPNEVAYPLVTEGELEFRWLHYRDVDPGVAARPAMKLDTLASIVGIPAGFTLDVEGAEFLVLKGAEKTLKENHPLVWVSIHPAFMQERFQTNPSTLHNFMADLGYKGTLLTSDHEEHWLFL